MASQGPNNPGTGANDSSFGTTSWANPGNIVSSNDSYASITFGTGTGTSWYLKGTNFGFSIPTGATINGIVVEIERKRGGTFVAGFPKDNSVKIVKSDGSIGSTNKASATQYPTTDTYATYGSSSDLWGETWTYSDINDADFGVVLATDIQVPSEAIGVTSVDHIRITVYYTASTSSNSNFLMFMR